MKHLSHIVLACLLIGHYQVNAMENAQTNYFAKVPKDLMKYLFEKHADLSKQNIPLVCKQFNEFRKEVLKKVNIECYGQDGYKIKFLKDELVAFGRKLVDEKFTEHIVYIDSQDYSAYLEHDIKSHRTFEGLENGYHALAKNESNPIIAIMFKHEAEYAQKKLENISKKIELENSQDFKGDKEIAHIYIKANRPCMETTPDGNFMHYNSERLMNYYNIVALHYFDKIVKNEEKHSSAYVMHKIKAIIRYLDAHKYALIYFPPYYDPNKYPSACSCCRINIRSFFDNPEALRYILENKKEVFTIKENWIGFIGDQNLSSDKISKETKNVIKEFLDKNSHLKEREDYSFFDPNSGSVGQFFCQIS